MLEGKVTEYVEFLANKDYGKAYNMRYGHQLGYGKPQSLSEFKAGYEGCIENIIIEKVEHMGIIPECRQECMQLVLNLMYS